MIRRALAIAIALAAGLLAVPPAGAEDEGGAIRGGEHPGFTRLVMQVDPRTEWSLETGDGRAVIRFPGKPLTFSTGAVFDRIPKDRVRSVEVATRGRMTEIVVALGCDCRISTRFVGARYLAFDVADRTAGPAGAGAEEDEEAEESAVARAARETAAAATAEELLVRQIERAARQGLVQLALTPLPAPAPRAAASGRLALSEPEPEPKPEPEAAAPAAADPIAALAEHDQIDAVTVYDRDDALEIARRARANVPAACLADAALDVADWSGPGLWAARRAALRAGLVGEFDRPDAEAVRGLARFYVRTGFGAEARALLDGFPVVEGLDDRRLLADLAHVVDGGDASPDGPLALAEPCPGRHALWLALGGVAPAYHDAATFAGVDAAFAELPPDLRTRLAPRLIGRMLDAARPAEARRLLEATLRDGAAPAPALRLAEARTLAAEGDAAAAAALFATLAESRDAVALEALGREVRLSLDADLPLRDAAVTDLRAALHEQRGTAAEVGLRALLVEALAARAEIPAAVGEARAAARALPGEAGRFGALAVRGLAAAAAQPVPPATYVDTVLASADLIAAMPPADPARRAIAARLVELGLPSPARRVVAPPVAAGDRGARLVAAGAEVALGRPAAARASLAGLNGQRAASLRTEAVRLAGDPGRGFALAAGRGASITDPGMTGAAWPAGAWALVGADGTALPSRLALAGFMQGPAAAPSDDPAALPPKLALREPLPDLSRPSLAAARQLLAVGPKVQGVVADALAGDR